MEIDRKRLDTAIVYLQRIADGNNPVNNMPAEEDSVLNNPNVIRCMYFVKEILEEVKRNNGTIGRVKRSKKEEFPVESTASFSYQEDKSITGFLAQLNAVIDEEKFKKLGLKPVMLWLKADGCIEEKKYEEFGNIFKVPTEKGIDLGMRTEERIGVSGKRYIVTVYGRKAQEYIVNHIKQILEKQNDISENATERKL